MAPPPEGPFNFDRRRGSRLTQALLIGALLTLMAIAAVTLG